MRFLVLLMSLLLVSACMPKPEKVIVKSTKLIYPSLPSIQSPPKALLEPVKFDWPRNMSKMSVKNTSKCRSEYTRLHGFSFVSSLNVDDYTTANELENYPKFWIRCGINEIDANSNVFIGLDELNYKNLNYNFKALLMRERQWEAILKTMNSLLDKWRSDEQVQTEIIEGVKSKGN